MVLGIAQRTKRLDQPDFGMNASSRKRASETDTSLSRAASIVLLIAWLHGLAGTASGQFGGFGG